MPSPLYFIQECPTCGRSLQIRVGYLGRQVVCQHCNGQFQAYDEGAGVPPPLIGHLESGTALMRRRRVARRSSPAAVVDAVILHAVNPSTQ